MEHSPQTLLNQLRHPITATEEATAEEAAIALGKLGNAGWAAIQTLCAANNADQRFWSVRALWANGSDAAVSQLIAMLADADEMVRSAAALALGEMHARSAIPALLKTMVNDVSGAGNHAADALSKMGAAAAPGLIAALGHAKSQVRIRAAKALVPIKNTAAIRPLIDRRENDDSYLVRHFADVALKRMGVGEMIYFK